MKPKVFEQIELKAPIDSPTFTGLPNSTTPGTTSNDTRIATTEFVNSLNLVSNLKTISTAISLNTLTTSGFYYLAAPANNSPWGNGQIAMNSIVLVGGNSASTFQIICKSGYGWYARSNANGSWSTWAELVLGSSDTFLKKAGGTMTGELVAQNNTNYTTAQVRNITISQDEPSGGDNGDIWLRYE